MVCNKYPQTYQAKKTHAVTSVGWDRNVEVAWLRGSDSGFVEMLPPPNRLKWLIPGGFSPPYVVFPLGVLMESKIPSQKCDLREGDSTPETTTMFCNWV